LDLRRAAAAVEIIHQWSLLEDDIIDDDDLRRGRPAAWTVFGVSRTILAADALYGQAIRLARELDDGKARSHLDALLSATLQLVAGQASELILAQSVDDVSVAKYVDVASAKTGALLACCIEFGIRLQGGDDAAAATATGIGHHLGVAWQATNDLEDIWSATEVTGKRNFSDAAQHKITLPFIYGSQDLGSMDHHPEPDHMDPRLGIDQMRARISSTRVREQVQQFSDDHLASAVDAARGISFDGYDLEASTAMLRFVVGHSKAKVFA
jgi:geranylgeranyl diphosphate synthase type I